MSESSDPVQYLTFLLDDEVFALEISKVREVLEHQDLTKVPRTPEFMKGVINLRDTLVPVLDLKKKFDLGDTESTVDTCIVIIEVTIDGEPLVLGALADSVQEVIDLEADEIVPPPKIGTRMNTEFISGMGKRGDGFVIILDADKVFGADDLAAVSEFTPDGEDSDGSDDPEMGPVEDSATDIGESASP